MTIARGHRKTIPLSVKLKAALAAAGFSEDEIEAPGAIQWDHAPALALRLVDAETGELVPPANDWRAIRPIRARQHLQKTCGRKVGAEKTATTLGSDVFEAAKARRLSASQEEMQRRILAKEPGQARPRKSRIPSRPFPNSKRREARKS